MFDADSKTTLKRCKKQSTFNFLGFKSKPKQDLDLEFLSEYWTSDQSTKT